MMKKRIKQGSALIVAAALVFSAFALPKTYAAIAVKTDKACSLQINVPQDNFVELKDLTVPVKLYKVADINVSGEYTAVEALSTLDFSDVNSESKAAFWEEKAALAKAAVDAAQIPATKEAEIKDGTVTVGALKTGLYLVDAQQTLSDDYQYDFKPYLISLPNNYYYTTQNDDWVYDLTGANALGLKPEKSDRYGDLVINKLLDAYNATLGGATFVFQVEAVKTDVDTKEERVVYSNVVSMTFDGPGTESVTIEDIPAGAEVIVTEIYSGASYTLTSDASQTTTIIADGEEGAPVNVDFSNTYDDRMNGGNGIVNHFAYEDGEWKHQATEDSTN